MALLDLFGVRGLAFQWNHLSQDQKELLGSEFRVWVFVENVSNIVKTLLRQCGEDVLCSVFLRD